MLLRCSSENFSFYIRSLKFKHHAAVRISGIAVRMNGHALENCNLIVLRMNALAMLFMASCFLLIKFGRIPLLASWLSQMWEIGRDYHASSCRMKRINSCKYISYVPVGCCSKVLHDKYLFLQGAFADASHATWVFPEGVVQSVMVLQGGVQCLRNMYWQYTLLIYKDGFFLE